MRVVTIVSLAASAVLGVGALVVANYVLPNAASAKGPLAGVAPQPEGQPLVVATRAIKYGEKLEASMLTVIKAPKAGIPEGAYTAVDAVLSADKGGAPVVLTPIAPREPILPTKVSGPGSRPIVSAEIADGMRAYTLKVDDAKGVGGHALPGDHVDVVLMRDTTPNGPERNYVSYVVVQNARVLGVDLNADPTSDKPATPSTATLEVSVEDSQKLAVAATLGELSLALRKNGETTFAATRPLRPSDFLGGGRPAAAAGGPRRSWSGIVVVEGEAAKRPRAAPKVKAAPATPSLGPVETAVGSAGAKEG
jgi:pilus assembly protein CpaB